MATGVRLHFYYPGDRIVLCGFMGVDDAKSKHSVTQYKSRVTCPECHRRLGGGSVGMDYVKKKMFRHINGGSL